MRTLITHSTHSKLLTHHPQRSDQLQARGRSEELISRLARDAQTWNDLRGVLATQMRAAESFAAAYHTRHIVDKAAGRVDTRRIESEVGQRIDRLDQGIRDLLQLVKWFGWEWWFEG